MKTEKTLLFYFSPTGGTKNAGRLLTERLCSDYVEYDISASAPELKLGREALAVFAQPVYGGRIPAPLYKRLESLQGDDTPAVVVSVYGNRAVDDAGSEMQEALRQRGFRVIAGAELIAPHSVCRDFGSGRPDEADLAIMDEFAEKLKRKMAEDCPGELILPGKKPYVSYNGIPIKPAAREKLCLRCGECARHCPAGAIDKEKPWKTDKKLCISCMGCLSICPAGARYIPGPMALAGRLSLKKLCSGRREPAFYI